MDDVRSRLTSQVADDVRTLAARHGVSYVHNGIDDLAYHITRLAGDDVRLDETEQLIIALHRAGHLSPREVVSLQAKYLHQAKP